MNKARLIAPAATFKFLTTTTSTRCIFTLISLHIHFAHRFYNPIQIKPTSGYFSKPTNFIHNTRFTIRIIKSLKRHDTFSIFSSALFYIGNFKPQPGYFFSRKINGLRSLCYIPCLLQIFRVT